VDWQPPGKASIALIAGRTISRSIAQLKPDAATLANDTVVRLADRISGTLWAATLDGLSHFDTQSQRFVTLPTETERSSYLSLAETSRISCGLDSFVGTGCRPLLSHNAMPISEILSKRERSARFNSDG